MELRIKDIVELLEVSEKTVYRWIKEHKIPCYRINHQYRFNRTEINEWILNNRISVVNPQIKTRDDGLTTDLAALIDKGGIHYIEGHTKRDVLYEIVKRISLPESLSNDDLFFALMNREDLMSTATGNGIALPHPRTPLITRVEEASVSIAFLKNPVDFQALDGQPVHTLFLILTSAPKRHLEVLSKIAHLCQHDDFVHLLKTRESKEKILDSVREYEKQWSETRFR